MSPGKLAAQVAHAAVEAYRLHVHFALPAPWIEPFAQWDSVEDQKIVQAWYQGGHYTKLVMAARDTEHLLTIERYIKERGFRTTLIIDEGRTEIPAHTPTALGVEIVDKDDPHVAATFESFKTYRAAPPESPPKPRTRPLRRTWSIPWGG